MQHLHLNKHLCLDSTAKIDEAEIILLGIPFDGTSTNYPGSRQAPYEIRKEFLELEKDSGFEFWDQVKFCDVGNVEVVHGDTEETLNRIKNIVHDIREKNTSALLITLGGEHLVTLPVVEELKPSINTLVSLDAHLDLNQDYMGVEKSHATVMKRISEQGVDVKILGYRAYSTQEIEYVQEKKLDAKGAGYKLEDLEKIEGNIYLSIDFDVVDPQQLPGVGNPTPGGINVQKLFDTIHKLKDQLVAADLTELNPLLDKPSAVIGAQTLIELMKPSQNS